MNHQIVISGVGGQGVLFITGLLANACMAEGAHVLTSETHGMAQRGGTVISHLKVGEFASPLIRPGSAELLIVLKSENLIQHRGFLNANGKAIVNAQEDDLQRILSTSQDSAPEESSRRNITAIDADALAKEGGHPGSVNLYMLGAALAVTPICALEQVKYQVKKRLKGKNEILIASAMASLEKGFATLSR